MSKTICDSGTATAEVPAAGLLGMTIKAVPSCRLAGH